MKYVYYVVPIVVLLMVGYWFFFGVAKPITNYPSAGTTVVAFGDSLIVGVGATEGNDLVSVLSQQIEQPIMNLGRSGDTTEAALERLPAVLQSDPKVVLVLLGGNDYLRKVPIDTTFANLEKIITSIQDTGAVVVLLGVRGGVLSDSYKDRYAELAELHGTAYVPNVLAGILGRSDLMSDAIHPNDAGYLLIAERIVPVLTPLLE